LVSISTKTDDYPTNVSFSHLHGTMTTCKNTAPAASQGSAKHEASGPRQV